MDSSSCKIYMRESAVFLRVERVIICFVRARHDFHVLMVLFRIYCVHHFQVSLPNAFTAVEHILIHPEAGVYTHFPEQVPMNY